MQNEFKESGSKKITRDTAKKYLENYLDASKNQGEKDGNILRSLTVSRSAIKSILAQEGCVDIRIYIGKFTPGKPFDTDHTLVLVGVDNTGENILDAGEIWDDCTPCPPRCPPPTTDF